jgi:hypothetical protein
MATEHVRVVNTNTLTHGKALEVNGLLFCTSQGLKYCLVA